MRKLYVIITLIFCFYTTNAEIFGLNESEKVKSKILAEQQQIEKRRQKMLEDIF